MIIDESDPMFGEQEFRIHGDAGPEKLTGIQKVNYDLAHRINREALANPQSPYAGKFVAIANGVVVAVADTLGAALEVLRQVEPDATRTWCVEAGQDWDVVEEVWELH